MTHLKHHEFSADWVDDEHGHAILIQQSDGWAGEAPETILHPHQLRQICEHFGILTADESASKEITALKRRMLVLRERINDLFHYMANHSDHKHSDMSHELNSLHALSDLAEEWCFDFIPTNSSDKPAQAVVETKRRKSAAKAVEVNKELDLVGEKQ